MCRLAITDGSFGWCQVAIFERFEDGCFRGGDASVFQDVVRTVGKAVGTVGFKIRAFLQNGGGINASPLA